MYLTNTPLTFVVNGRKIEIDAIPQAEFEIAWEEANRYDVNQADQNFFNYVLVVGIAISKYLGYKVFARHKSGNIAFEAYDIDDSFSGSHTVYSDYVQLHSIDLNGYKTALKDIA